MVAMSRSRSRPLSVSANSSAIRSRVLLSTSTRSSSISFRLLASGGGLFLGAICGVMRQWLRINLETKDLDV